jgi:hypothetical protein
MGEFVMKSLKSLMGVIGVLFSTSAFAFEKLEIETQSEKGHTVVLSFDQNPVKTGRTVGTLCSSEEQALTKAVLWMPDMGHGSSPTRIKAIDVRCALVERMNFMMSGFWEVRAEFADGDKAVFGLTVED